MTSSLLTTIRDLQRRKGRERRGLAVAEGVRLVEEALAAGVAVRGVATSPGLEATPRGKRLKESLAAAHIPAEPVDERTLAELAGTEHPQGIIAVIESTRWRLDQMPAGSGRPVLVLDGIQDPGNVGTIIRSALGFGAAGVISLKGTADLWNPKAVRGSMGALFRLPAVAASDAEFRSWLAKHGVALWVADAAGTPAGTLRPPPRLALLLGNEGAGPRPELAGVAHERVSVPLQSGVESLNVAVAAGILLYEVTRER